MTGFRPIFAEVADKEPTITAVWIIAAVICFIGFLICRCHRVAGFLAVTFATLWAWAIFSELHDPYVGPAIVRELGQGYVTQAYLAALIPFFAVAIGFWRRGRDANRGRGCVKTRNGSLSET